MIELLMLFLLDFKTEKEYALTIHDIMYG